MTLKKLFLAYFIAQALVLNVFGQAARTGGIKGNIVDSENGEPLIGVTVRIAGTTVGANTDVDGNFVFGDVLAGKYDLILSYISYQTDTLRGIAVTSGQMTSLIHKLLPEGVKIEGVEITATRTSTVSTDISVVADMRTARGVVTGISAQQIMRSQDRDASEVVRRTTGVTILGGRFVVVRGIPQRYNSVMLNDIYTPSSENDARAFSFDLVPSGLIDKMLVYKTGAPELPGDFAGALIKITTRNAVENSFTIGYSTSFRQGTTFDKFSTYEGSKTDWIGFDNDKRPLAKSFPASIALLQSQGGSAFDALNTAARSLPNIWTTNSISALPDQRINLSFSRLFGKGRIKWGALAALTYSNTSQTLRAQRNLYNELQAGAATSEQIYDFQDNIFNRNVRIGGLLNLYAQLSPRHRIEWKNFANQLGQDQTIERTGKSLESGSDVQGYGLRYQSRTIFTSQLSGTHRLTDLLKVNWAGAYSNTKRDEPDFRRVVLRRPTNSTTPFTVTIPPGASNQDASRFFSDTKETNYTGTVDVEYNLKPSTDNKTVPALRVGAYIERKDRDFAARWMSYAVAQPSNFNNALRNLPLNEIFAPQNLDVVTGFSLFEGTNFSDKYRAVSDLFAAYAGFTWPVGNFTFAGGARLEQYKLVMTTGTETGTNINRILDSLTILPSLNISYNLNKNSLVRVAYFMSVNRPEFREISRFTFYDFEYNFIYRGNDSLKQASIHNLDVRYEWYPSLNEMIAIGGFYKRFDSPIEVYYVPGAGSGGTNNYTFRNAESASSYGVEVEFRKSLSDIFSASRFLSKLSANINASYVLSEVSLGRRAVGQTNKRPLLGQSPYTINVGLFYTDEEKGWQINTLYNVFGERLFLAGNVGQPDIYELPRNVLDLNVVKKLGQRYEVRLGIQDILNQQFRLRQDSNQNQKLDDIDENILSYRPGAYLTLGFNVRL